MAKNLGAGKSLSRVWLHFLGLTAMSVVLIILGSAGSLKGGDSSITWGLALYAGMVGMPGVLYEALPIIAGISLGAERVGNVSAKMAWFLIITVVALMAFLDVVAPVASKGKVLQEEVAFAEGEVRPRFTVPQEVVRAIPTTLAVLRGDVSDVDERLGAYPINHGRVTASRAILRLGLMLAPLSIVGIVLGVLGWVDRRVIFRTPSDEGLARVVMAWTISPVLMWAMFSLMARGITKVLFEGQPLSLILVPQVPFVVLAILGLHWATRSERLEEKAPPEEAKAHMQ